MRENKYTLDIPCLEILHTIPILTGGYTESNVIYSITTGEIILQLTVTGTPELTDTWRYFHVPFKLNTFLSTYLPKIFLFLEELTHEEKKYLFLYLTGLDDDGNCNDLNRYWSQDSLNRG